MKIKRYLQWSLLPWILISTIAAAALFAGCQAWSAGGEQLNIDKLAQDVLHKLQKDDNAPLAASGTIQADEIRIASELGGHITRMAVQKGDPVQIGDVLVVLDDTSLSTKLSEAEAAVAAAQADLSVTRAGPRDEEIAAMQAMLALAQAQRDGAKSAWQNAQDALRNPQSLDAQIVDAQTQVNLAEQGAALAEAELSRQKLIRDQKRQGSTERDVADWQVKAAEEKLAAAQADLHTAQTLLNGLKAIREKPLGLIVHVHIAEGQYKVAEAGIVVAQAQLDDLLAGSTAEEIALAEQAVRLEEAKANVLRSQQAKFVLASPANGIVLDQALHVGELATPAATILTVADLSRLTLVVYVQVNQIGRVQLGQEVQVTVDSFPNQTFTGHVARIGDQPEFTPRNIATQEERINTFYAVEIELPNEQGLLKPGMPADVLFK